MGIFRPSIFQRSLFQGPLILSLAAGLALAPPAPAQNPTTMAPPVQSDAPQGAGGGAASDSVFNWQEVPQNQQVPLTGGSFDQGGYQLYDNVGETIIVPFTGQNLYVMKFARSATGTMYFINQGGVPILYVPRHGYLTNATVSGARWYPFGKGFHPAEPVYLGVAPSWPQFVGMGWYPNMYAYGGYWGQTSFVEGGVFGPSVGLFFNIGGHPYYGWNGYRGYYQGHPGFSHVGYYRRDFYRAAGRPHASFRQFGSPSHTYSAHRAFTGARGGGGRAGFSGGGHSFRGGSGFGGQTGHVSGVGHEHGGHMGKFSGGRHVNGGRGNGGEGGHVSGGNGGHDGGGRR